MKFCAVLMLAMCGAATGACFGDDDAPLPGRDGGPGADGSTADGPGDRTPPVLLETDPVDGATGVAPMLAITVRFNEPVLVREPADGLRLLDEAGQRVPGTVEVDGDTLRFVPANDLALLGSYTAVVTPAITDLAGNPLPREYRVHLSVRDGIWDAAATPLEHSDTYLSHLDVAMNARGDVVVVWAQYDSPSISVWAKHYDARTSRWGASRRIEHEDASHAIEPRVAMDEAGNAIAVWQQSDDTRHQVWASRYQAGTGWEEPVRLSASDTADAYGPRVAMNHAGAAIVVWRHTEGMATQAWTNRYVAGMGWGEAEPVQVDGQPAFITGWDYTTPQVGIDADGDAIVIVLDHVYQILAVPHLASSGWGEAETLSQGSVDPFALAVAPGGHALALWSSRELPSIHAWRRDPGGASHSDVLMLGEGSDDLLRAGDVAVTPAGDGIVVWFEHRSVVRQVWVSVYASEAQGWTSPEELFPGMFIRPRMAQVRMDSRGHAHAICILSDGNDYMVLATTRRVVPGGSSTTTLYHGVEDASLAVNAQGKAVLVRAVQTADRHGMDLDAMLFR
jgi:hypothetical protein